MPVDRRQLRRLAVTEVDPFLALRYVRRREETPRVLQLERAGAKVLPGVEGALLDLFDVLWEPDPRLKPAEAIDPGQRYWHTLLEQALKSSAYQEVHASTVFSEIYSLIGAMNMAESVLGLVPKKDQKQLEQMQHAQQNVQEAQAAANQAQQAASTAQQLADAAQHGESQAQANAQANPQDGQAQAAASQAQASAQQHAQAAQQAQEQAVKAQMTLDQAKAFAEQLANELMGQPGSQKAQQRETQLRRMAHSALKQAKEQVQEVSGTLEAWGTAPGELEQLSIPEVVDLANELRRTKDFEEFVKMLGAMKRYMKAKHERNRKGKRMRKSELGRDIRRAQRRTVAMLVVPGLRYRALQMWANGSLPLEGAQHLEKVGKGAIVYLEDGSGSMSGPKRVFAKALGLALAYYCELEGRDFVWIHFGAHYSTTTVRVYPKGRMTLQQKLEFRKTFLNAGGTSFERPIEEAMAVIRGEKADLPKVNLAGTCDIVMGSDGMATVRVDLLKKYLAFKEKFDLHHITMLMDVGSSSDASVVEFSNRIEKVSSFTAESAERQVFAHLH